MHNTEQPTFTVDSNVAQITFTFVTKNTVRAGSMDTRVRFASVTVKFWNKLHQSEIYIYNKQKIISQKKSNLWACRLVFAWLISVLQFTKFFGSGMDLCLATFFTFLYNTSRKVFLVTKWIFLLFQKRSSSCWYLHKVSRTIQLYIHSDSRPHPYQYPRTSHCLRTLRYHKVGNLKLREQRWHSRFTVSG